MSKLLYSATMSLDGYIAGPGGDMSWLSEYVNPEKVDVEGLVAQIGALLIGRRTFSGDDPNKGTKAEGAFGGRWSGPSIVLTHEPPDRSDDPDVTYSTDLAEAVAAAREAAAGKYVNVLGADIARQCLEAGELDEVLVTIAPVLLGEGTPLFRREGGPKVALVPIDPEETGPLRLWYRVA